MQEDSRAYMPPYNYNAYPVPVAVPIHHAQPYDPSNMNHYYGVGGEEYDGYGQHDMHAPNGAAQYYVMNDYRQRPEWHGNGPRGYHS